MSLNTDAYTVSQSLISGQLPSIYEIIAEDNLTKSLRSGIKYLSQVLASNYPSQFRLLHLYFDEIYLVLELIVSGLHLSSFNASFSEYFYHLKRLKCDSTNPKECLSTRDLMTSLLMMVSFPYIKAKLDKTHDELSRIHFDGLITRDNDKFAYHFVNNYPYIKTFWELSCLVYQIKYAVGKGSSHSPLFHLLGLRLIRSDPRENFTISTRRSLKARLASSLTNGFGFVMTSTALIIQFLDYWYTRENSRSSLSTLNIPPAPPSRRDLANCPPNKCPICLQDRQNEVLLKTSGFLFCHDCLLDFVEKYEKCPVTGYPTSRSQIVGIYLPDSY